MKLREQQEKGERANIALSELEAAFQALESDCFDAFANSDIHDDAGRKTCRLYLEVMADVKERFETAIRNGEAANHELLRLKDPSRFTRLMYGRGD